MKVTEKQHRAALYELMNYDGLYGISKKIKDEAAKEKENDAIKEALKDIPEYIPSSQKKKLKKIKDKEKNHE